MSGISPPSKNRSRSRTSGESSFSDPELFQQSGQSMIPAVATILRFREPAPTPQRTEGYSSSSAASPPQRGPELSATQATFLAGAAVTHAHHASGVALGACCDPRAPGCRERATNGSASPGGRYASQCASCHGRGATPWRSTVDCASRAGYRGRKAPGS